CLCPPVFPYTTLFRSRGWRWRVPDLSSPVFLVHGLLADAERHRDGLPRVAGEAGAADGGLFGALEFAAPLGDLLDHPQRRLVLRSEEHTSELQSRENL